MANNVSESEFYKKISQDMHQGLKEIYKEIENHKVVEVSQNETKELFDLAHSELEAVLEHTKTATDEIMTIVEKHLELDEAIYSILEKAKKEKLACSEVDTLEQNCSELNKDLTTILTSLSFQDLTGQRIQKAVKAIRTLEEMVFDLLVSSSFMMKSYDKSPNQDINSIEKDAKQAVADIRKKVQGSELKGPSKDTNQADIDGLLDQLGL